MIRFKTKITGLREVIKKVEAYNQKMGDDISVALDNGVQFAVSQAKQLAPIGRTGALGGFISADLSRKYDKSFTAHAPYSAYVEFGTGSRVFQAKSGFMFTPEMKAFAREFYVNGMGRMPASPFMFPALELAKVEIIKNIKKVLLGPVKL